MEAIRSSETSVVTKGARRHIAEDGIPQSHRRENRRSYRALIGSDLQLRRNLSPVRYEISFYIPEDGILQGNGREHV
jgi:hypothetical protein